ncbi:hypothetical protein Tco_1048813 [Tanacetum coccineum]
MVEMYERLKWANTLWRLIEDSYSLISWLLLAEFFLSSLLWLVAKLLGVVAKMLEWCPRVLMVTEGSLHWGSVVASSGWPFVFAVPGQMTHLVASLTLDSARSCVMQGAFLTQGKASSIPTIFSWGDSISPDSFLPSILLLLVIIVAVAIVVTVILVVVVGEGSSIIKLSFVIIGSLHIIMLCYLIH